MAFVIDASCFAAMLLNEEVPEPVRDLLASLPSNEIVVPALWYWEVGNAALMATRRKRIAAAEVHDQLADFRDLTIAVDRTAMDSAWTRTYDLAVRHNLTLYDAAYLELAIRRGLPLGSLDDALVRAAKAEGVEVIGT
ncbi:MAG TPA: type II toxin-antitoxin system VapC family toxin [Thermomicrobiales bacterium]|nr:type II toxin-antitoxin system VapC family toxin [Thermomicrobiales bacterium]